jgi:hypothetical protein
MTFEDAVGAAVAPIFDAFHAGKQALKGEHRDLVKCRNARRFTGSIDLEAALMSSPPREQINPWDYGLGFRENDGREAAIWIEVHPASTSEVTTILKKLEWLRNWLRNEAPELHAMSRRSSGESCFLWLATPAGVHIRSGSPQARRLQQAGLTLPRQTIELK